MKEQKKSPKRIFTDEERRSKLDEVNSMLERAHKKYAKKLGLLPRDKKK